MWAVDGEALGFELLLEEKDFIVVDKSPGSNLHRNQRGRSMVDEIREALQLEHLYLVHRLDDATSGLLILAKNAEAAAKLAALFAQRHIEKFYLAIAEGKPAKKQGSVEGDLEKSRNGSYRLSRDMKRPSMTQFFSFSLSPGRRLYVLKPLTGKTHQLRVVMKSLGVPIFGDGRYGPAAAIVDRLYLHAYALRFHYNGKPYSLVCNPHIGEHFRDGALGRALLDLQLPWELPWPKPKQPPSLRPSNGQ